MAGLQYRTGASTASCSAKGLISHVFVFNLTPSARFYLVWTCPVMLLPFYSAFKKPLEKNCFVPNEVAGDWEGK